MTDSVSSPVSSCRLDSIYPFDGDNFNISVLIEFVKFHAIIDIGAAVTAFDTKAWNKYLIHAVWIFVWTEACAEGRSSNFPNSTNVETVEVLVGGKQ